MGTTGPQHRRGGWGWQDPEDGICWAREYQGDLDHPRLHRQILFLMSSSPDLHHITLTAASRGAEATPRRTVTSTLEDN